MRDRHQDAASLWSRSRKSFDGASGERPRSIHEGLWRSFTVGSARINRLRPTLSKAKVCLRSAKSMCDVIWIARQLGVMLGTKQERSDPLRYSQLASND